MSRSSGKATVPAGLTAAAVVLALLAAACSVARYRRSWFSPVFLVDRAGSGCCHGLYWFCRRSLYLGRVFSGVHDPAGRHISDDRSAYTARFVSDRRQRTGVL